MLVFHLHLPSFQEEMRASSLPLGVLWGGLLLIIQRISFSEAWRGFCPLRCHCNDDELAVRCDDASLDVIPITLNPGLRELHLSRNNIKNILGSFSVYAQLENLNVSYNQLANLNKNNFHLRHLKRLDLGNNYVEQVNAETFKGLQVNK